MKRKLLVFFLLLFIFLDKGFSQIIIPVNLSGAADTSVTISSGRNGSYCGDNNCVVFVVTLNPGSDLLNISSGQLAASNFYTVNCGPQTPVGTPVCVSGLTTANIAFCKPGNNTITYTITASTAVHASGDITLRQGCTGTMSVTGLNAATITWTSVYPGATGAYNSYLSCPSGCATTSVTPIAGAPAYIDYKVSGIVTNCANTKADTVRVYTVPAMTIALTPASPVICAGGSGSVILTATPSGGNPPYTYLWSTGATTQSISVSSVVTYSVSVADNTAGCAPVPQSVTVTAAPTPAAPTAAGTSVCSGSTATITATAPGGTYQWYNAASGGTLLVTNPSYTTPTLTSTATYYVQTTVGGCPSARTAVTVTVNPIPVAPTAASISTCSGSNATLTATGPGGTYDWYNAASGGTLLSTGATYTTPALTTNTTYYVQTTVNGCVSPRTAVTVSIISTPVAPTAAGTSTCSGTAVTLTATAPGGNYDWYDAATGGTLLLSGATYTTPVLTSTTTYYVQTTVGGCVSARTPVTVTANAIPAAPTASDATICNGTTATLTATAPGGTYQWYSAASGGTLLFTGANYTTPALTSSTTYYVQTTVNGCTSPRSAVNVTVNPVTAAPTASGATICAGSAATLTATAPGGTYDWFSASSGGLSLFTGATYTTPTLTTTTTYYVQATVNGCTGARTAVTVTVNPTPAAPTASGTAICSGNTATLTATAPGGIYDWYDSASGGTLLSTGASFISPALTTTTTYYVQTTVNGCASARTAVTVTVNPLPAAPTASGSTICQGSAASLTATAPGGTYNWYSAASGGTLLFTGGTYTTPALTNTTTYYVDATSASGCTGPRTAVTATVTPPVNPSFSYPSGTFCKTGGNQTPTIFAPSGTFSSAPGGLTIDPNTGVIDPATSTVGTYTITFVTNTSCIYSSSLSITITNAPDATFSYSGPYCQSQANPLPTFSPGASSGIFSSTTGLVFLNPSTGEIDMQGSTPGTYTVTNNIAAAGGCAADSKTNTITINPAATVNAGADQIVCSGQTVTLNGVIGGGATSATWSGGTGGFANATSPATTYTLGPGETSVTLTLTTDNPAGPCGAASDQMTITVNPTPVVTSSPSGIICSNAAQSYAITSSVSGTTYTWSRAVVAGISNGAVSGQTSSSITETLVNTTSAPINVAYAIVPLANGCTGPTFTYTITVNPTPTVTSAASGTICNNTAQNYTITSNVSGATYTWSRAAVAGINNVAISGQTSSTITETLINTTSAPINVSYSILPSANGCDGPVFTYTVTVNPTPIVSSAASVITCNNSAQNYNITSNVSGTTYTWDRAAVAGISNTAVTGQTSNPVTESLINTTPAPVNVVYTIIPSANSCSGPAFTYTVAVNPTPIVTSAPSAPACSNTTQNYTITSNVSGATYTWSRAAVAGISNAAVSGQTSNIINEALTNTTNAPVAVAYSIVPAANGCSGPMFTYTVTVNPTPTVTSTSNATICNNTAQSYTLTSNVSGTTFTWNRAAVAGISNGTVSGQTSNTITESLINTTASPINVSYTILPSANGCDGPSFTYTITVNPTPTVTSALSAIMCDNTSQNYTITSNVSGTTFTWNRAAVAGISNGALASQTANPITETLVNTTAAPIDVSYSILPAANGCSGPAFTYTVTVNPTPTVTSVASAIICNNTAQNYTITGNVSGTTYTWSRASVAGIGNAAVSGQTTNTITETLVNTTVNPIDVTYTISPQANGCTGPTFTYTVTVNPTPRVTSPANAITCNNTAQNYTITSNVNGTTYTWSRAAVAGISNAAVSGQTTSSITESLTNTGSSPIVVTYVIIPTTNGCAGPAFNYSLTVNPTPVVTSAASATICNNTSQNYTITGNVTASNFTWSRAAVAGISNAGVSGQTSGSITETLVNTTSAPVDVSYTITPDANGCTGPTFTYTVTVNPTPTVTSAANATICNNTGQNYTITGSVSGTTYTWSRAAVAGISNAAVSGQTSNTITENLINTTSVPINVLYSITPAANGCSGPAFTYTVTVNPTPTVTSAASATICNNTVQNYTITSNVSATAYIWSRAAVAGISNTSVNGQTSNSITESLINTTSAPVNVLYTIIPSANSCDGPTFTYTVTINPTPTVTSGTSATTCNNTAQNYTITGNVSGTTYTWSRVAVAGISNGAVSGQTSNPITESLINTTSAPIDVAYTIVPAANGCGGPAFAYIVTVNPTPTVTSPTSATICNNTTQNYTVTSNVSGTTYTWSRAAVAGISNAAVSGQTTSTITESLINTGSSPIAVTYIIVPLANGCAGPAFNYNLTVNPTPVVTSAASATICNNIPQNYTITGNVTGSNFTWSRAAVTGISNAAVSGQTSGSITETLVNTTSAPVDVSYTIIPDANGCTGPVFTYTITVNPTPTVTSAASAATCNNIAQNYTITGNVSGTTYTWSRTAIPGINNPAVSGQASSTITESLINITSAPVSVAYNIVPTANGCSGPAFTYTVTVNPTPTVTSAASAAICNNTAQNYAITSNVSGATYTWSRAAVAGISNAAVSGQTSNTITESLINTTALPINVSYSILPSANSCDGPMFTYTVTVNPTPTVTSLASAITCDNTPQNYIITGNVSGTTFTWSRAAVAGISNAAVSNQTTGVITESLVNTTSAPVNVLYSIVPTANGCSGPTFTYTVTVNPTPIVTSAASATICNNTAQNYVITSNVSGATYTWSRAAITGISNAAVSGQTSNIITESLINTTSAPVNVFYAITPTTNGCSGPVFNYTITVNPTPTVTSAANATTCNNTAQNYTITNNVSGTTYTWDRAAVAGISNTAVSGQTSNPITESLINITSAPVSVAYTIAPSANGCTGPIFTYTVTVNPTPTVTSAAGATTCNNTAQNYTITGSVSGTTYAWSRAAIPGINNPAVSGQTGNTITESLINTTSTPVNVLYNIVPTANGCSGPAFTYTVTVNPTPTVTSAASGTICNNTAQNYTITSNVSGATYTWSKAAVAGISNTAVSGQTNSTITESLINTTSAPVNVPYTITPSANGCTGPAFTYMVTVNPTPIVISAANSIICNNTAQNYIITSNVSGATFTWGRAAVAGISNAAVSNQTTVTVTESLVNTTSTPINVLYTIVPSANGCSGTAFTYTVTVNPTPTITSAASAITCNNIAQNYVFTSNVSGATYTWSRAGVAGISNAAVSGQTSGMITESLVNTTSAPVNVLYFIIPSANGCSGPTFTYTVTVNPTPTVTSAASGSICNNTAQNYTVTSNVSGTTYTWSRAAVAGISNAAVSGQTSNTITESLINTTSAPVNALYTIVPSANGCSGPAFTYTLMVNPTSTVTSAVNGTICNNTAQNYAITSNVSGATYTWNRAAVAGISNSAVSGQTNSTITESLVNTKSAPVNVLYTIVPTANGCSGPVFTYTVTVNPTPTVTSAASGTICNNTVQNYAITSNVGGTTYTWSRAAVAGISNAAVNGQSGNAITETLVNTASAAIAVTYQIVPSINGCPGAPFNYTLTVNPAPIVTNNPISQTVCSQGSNTAVIFTSNVAGATFQWTATATPKISGFASSGTGNIPSQILLNSDVVPGTITYTVTPYYSGCAGTTSNYIITVNPKPATPVASSNSPVCQNYALSLTTPAIAGATYTWIGPNGFTSNAQNPTITNATPAAAGLYSLLVTVNGCTSDIGSTNVTILSTPAAPAASSNSPLCAGNTLILNAGSIAGATYVWTGPNGFTSTVQNPSITNIATAGAGTYSVTATVNGCTSPAGTAVVVVNAIPAAPTATSNSPVCEAGTINLSVSSKPGTTYTWTGPNNFFSNLPNPSIPAASQANAGIYTVTATAGNCTGAPTSVMVEVDATPINPVASSNSPVCTGNAITLTSSTFIGATYKWTGPNGFSSTLQSPVINGAVPASAGTYTVSITAPGCSVTTSTTTKVVVNQTPIAPTAGSNSPVCIGDNLNLTASGVAGATYSWTGPNGFSSTLQNPVVSNMSASTAGAYSVTVTVSSCTSAAATTNVIVSKPELAFAGNDQVVCANNSKVTLAGNIIGDSNSGIWTTSGTGTFSPSATSLSGTYLPSAADISAGNVTLTLSSTNNGGCSISSSSFKVTINPKPIVNAGGNKSMCTNDAAVAITGSITYAPGGKWTSTGTGTFAPSDVALNMSYIPSAADKAKGSVKLTLSSTGNNCLAVTDVMTLTIIPSPTITMPDVKYVLEGETTVLDPAVTGTNLQYLWTPPFYLSSTVIRTPTLKGVASQLYNLKVTGLGGCITEQQIMVNVLKPIIIPNTFTPNGDGINDLWIIKELANYPGAGVTIFNRYGTQLYYSKGYAVPWDGTYNGKPLPVGTYYYIISRGIYGSQLSGYVVIMR